MKHGILRIIIFTVLFTTLYCINAAAKEGDSGYDGGISSGENPVNKLMDYKEVVFVSGEPIIFEGTSEFKRSTKNSKEVLTYKYTLKNEEKNATLNRTLTIDGTFSEKENGQVQKQYAINKIPSERIVIGNTTYVLRKMDFNKTSIVDNKGVGEYFAGNLGNSKVYSIISGTGTSAGEITISATGQLYGFNHYWSSNETQVIKYTVQGKYPDKTRNWQGTVDVKISSTIEKDLQYQYNKPTEISFAGGYILSQKNVSILKYDSHLPEFSANKATDYIMHLEDDFKYESFPLQTRLMVPDISLMKGHWAEKDAELLYSLEIFSGNPQSFNPDTFITRGEFAKAIILTLKITDDSVTKVKPAIPYFDDVPYDNEYYKYVMLNDKYKIINGEGTSKFNPNGVLTKAQATAMFTRALGFESMAPGATPITMFKDDSDIPVWSKRAVYTAQKIGLIEGDQYSNLEPNKTLTKGEVSKMLVRFIDYMRKDLVKDYRERLISY